MISAVKKFVPFCFLVCAFATVSSAQTTYLSRTAYNTAHPLNFITDFNNYGPDGTYYASGLTVPTVAGNVTFLGTPQTATSTEILSSTHFGFSDSANFVLQSNPGAFLGPSMTITLPANTFSFGTDVISPSATILEQYRFTMYSGSTVLSVADTPVSLNGQYVFFGFDSLTTAITSVTVGIDGFAGSPNVVIDNFTVVPEPSTWIAGALGLGVLAFPRIRRSARA